MENLYLLIFNNFLLLNFLSKFNLIKFLIIQEYYEEINIITHLVDHFIKYLK